MRVLFLLLILIVLPFSSAAEVVSDVYTVDSYHMGSAGGEVDGVDYTGRDTLTHQQPGGDDAQSNTTSANLGWFEKLVVPVEEPTSGGGGGGGGGARPGVQFDVKILEFESPVAVGGLFDFEYFVKGVGSINSDVTIEFWIEKDGEIVTSGSDVIFMGMNEELTETGSLFLPDDMESGNYKFVIRASYGDIFGEAHREIGITVDEGVAVFQKLFDISFFLERVVLSDSDELVAVITFVNFGTVPTEVDLMFVVLDEFGDEVYRGESYSFVKTEEVLRKKFLNLGLPPGEYMFRLGTLYGDDVFDVFEQRFTIRRGFFGRITSAVIGWMGSITYFWILFVIIILLLLLLIIVWRRCRSCEECKVKSKYSDKVKKAPEKKVRVYRKIKKEVGKI
jgi:hypothetical protein